MKNTVKILLLHTRLSGYLAACLRAYKRRTDAEILIYAWPIQPNAPFDVSVFADLGEICNRRDFQDSEIDAAVQAFGPDAILVSGWADKGYVRVCRRMRKQGVPVIAGCDTQWKGSLRQHLAGMTSRIHVQRAIDVLWVTGERQRTLANALGYRGDRCWDGYYACDWERFARPIAETPQRRNNECPDSDSDAEHPAPLTPHGRGATRQTPFFLYVGRYAPEKGLDTLAEAYRMYCDLVYDPWLLRCAGAGPLRELLVSAGAEDLGFVQPDDLPALMHAAAAFVLPSRFEPWGVVAQEAAASGLPLILSDACGAGVHLLRHLYNGYGFPAGSADALARTLVAMHQLPEEFRRAYGRASFELSRQYTPDRWAETLSQGLHYAITW